MVTPIVIISRDNNLDTRVRKAVGDLNQPVVHFMAPRRFYDANTEKNRCINIAMARTQAFRKALDEWDAEYFFSLDDDILINQRTIHQLAGNKVPVVGGWFRMKNARQFCVGGQFSGDVFTAYRDAPSQDGLTATDLLSLGCTLIHRSLLENHTFNPGVDETCMDHAGKRCFLADSGAFSRHCQKQGIPLYLDNAVHGDHL